MIGVSHIREHVLVDEALSDSLYSLARNAHSPSDRCRGEWLVKHGTKHLPPGDGEADRPRNRLAGRQHLPIELEYREG